jgi:hypothetical protein
VTANLNPQLRGARWRRCLLLMPLVALVALSACRAETEPGELVALTEAGDEAILHSKVTLGEGEQGRVWFEACPTDVAFAPRCRSTFEFATEPVPFGPTPKQGGPWGPFDFKRRVVLRHLSGRGTWVFRICADLLVNGQRTGPVCWDSNGKAEDPSATNGNYDYALWAR